MKKTNGIIILIVMVVFSIVALSSFIYGTYTVNKETETARAEAITFSSDSNVDEKETTYRTQKDGRVMRTLTDWRPVIDIHIPKGFFPEEWGAIKDWTPNSNGGLDFNFENKTVLMHEIRSFVTERYTQKLQKLDKKDNGWLSIELEAMERMPFIIPHHGKLYCLFGCLEEEDYFYFSSRDDVEGFVRINHDGHHTVNMLYIGRGGEKGMIL